MNHRHSICQVDLRKIRDSGDVLASTPSLVPAESERFQVPRQSVPLPGTFDPFCECNGNVECHQIFYQPLCLAKFFISKHRKRQHGIRDGQQL